METAFSYARFILDRELRRALSSSLHRIERPFPYIVRIPIVAASTRGLCRISFFMCNMTFLSDKLLTATMLL